MSNTPLTTARAVIISGMMVAGSILLHAWITRPPSYQIASQSQGWFLRFDTRTGAVLRCSSYDNAPNPPGCVVTP
jgi:hypothetical protein